MLLPEWQAFECLLECFVTSAVFSAVEGRLTYDPFEEVCFSVDTRLTFAATLLSSCFTLVIHSICYSPHPLATSGM